ncbi:MAG: hypothetical protein ACRC4M_02450 [Mycoplasma sp.]
MLKAIFMDLVPYIIQKNCISNSAWSVILQDKYPEYINDKDFCKAMNNDILTSNILSKLESKLKDEEVQELKSNYLLELVKAEFEYFENFEFENSIKELFEKAEANDCHIYILTWHEEYYELLPKVKWPNNVDCVVVNEKSSINSAWVTEFASKHDIPSNEFLTITQDETRIDDMISNNLFCATINQGDSDNRNLYITSSIGKLDFDEIIYNFYETTEDESGEL